MGVQQRLRRHDVINLLASGLFGVALATILLLTIGAYARLSADVDAHLQHIAAAVNDKFTGEVEHAAQQLQKMADTVGEDKCAAMDGSQPAPAASQGSLPEDRRGVVEPEESGQFRLSGFHHLRDGGPVRTAGGEDRVLHRDENDRGRERPRLLPTRLDARAAVGTTAKPTCPGRRTALPNGCYLEYISSWNTGQPQVVISMPTAIPRLPVATLSIPMHALLAPVLPHGFEFAVVDSGGTVQFHSDPQRNGQEKLLLETDQNPRLRSLAAARSSGTFNTMYWGYPYRGYVRPTRIPGWSIVVFQAKQTSRALVLEWFTVAMLLTGLYTVGWVVVMLLSLQRGASWLWPDPLRRHWYVPLGCLAVAAIAVWLAIAWWHPVPVTAIAGIVIPILTWVVVYVVLAVRPAGSAKSGNGPKCAAVTGLPGRPFFC